MTTPDGLTAESEALRDASLGMRLREYRKKEGLTLREAAKRAGISHSHLSKVETGRDWATDRTVRLLAAVYDAEPDMLLMDRNIDRVPYIVRRAIEAAAVARHVRETGCDGLREANERLRSALSACGDYIVGLGLPMGSRPVWETEYHALIDLIDGLLGGKHYPWLAALAPTVAATEEVEHAAQ